MFEKLKTETNTDRIDSLALMREIHEAKTAAFPYIRSSF